MGSIHRFALGTINFPFEINCFMVCNHKYMNMKPPIIELNLWEPNMTMIQIVFSSHFELPSLRSRRYSRAQGGKLEIPPAQKLSILSSAHRAHGSAHINVFALENQSERELLIMILAGWQCSKRCQFINNCFVFFCHGEQSNSHETFAKAYTVNIMLFPNPVGKIAITSLPSNRCWIDTLCSHFKTMGRPIADK